MIGPIRAHKDSRSRHVWLVFSRRKLPSTCPNCKDHTTWKRVGYNSTYTKDLYAKIHRCDKCGTQLDQLWLNWMTKPITSAAAV